MIERNFSIATSHGNFAVKGFATDAESMIGIHHDNDGPQRSPYWSVTFLPTGTKIDSLFATQMRTKGCREILLDFIARLEAAEQASWLMLSTLPWGCFEVPAAYMPAIERLKAAAHP